MQKRRVRILWVQGFMFLIWQGAYFGNRTDLSEPLRRVDQVKIGAIIVWAAALMLLLATGGGWWRSKAIRDMANDEVTRDHRRSAYTWGYWALVVTSFALYGGAVFNAISLIDAAHALLSVAVIVPIMRFVWLDRRAG